jgi:Icc-related predicted phosphoesterase
MTKIVFISDTHNHHDEVKLPKGDILVHSGDFSGRGLPEEIASFFDWLEIQAKQFEHVIFIAGNHDMSFEYKGPWIINWLSKLPTNVHYLEDSEVTLEGIKFYGTPWQPEFHNWGFNLPRGEKLAEKWALIPNDTDVLITHGPPATILDYTMRDNINVGCVDLLYKVKEIKPKINVFGHIHEGYGYRDIHGTLFINASTCTLRYQPTNPPVTVKFSKENIEFIM